MSKFKVGDIVRFHIDRGEAFDYVISNVHREGTWHYTAASSKNGLYIVFLEEELRHTRIKANNVSRKLNPDMVEEGGYLYESSDKVYR